MSAAAPGTKAGRGKAAKTQSIEIALLDILGELHPMTVRQAYYQLVSRQIVENRSAQYQAVSKILVEMRKTGAIPWEWIEDRTRQARIVSTWDGLPDFAECAVASYRLNPWNDQETLVEVWLEKDALSGIFEEILDPFAITLNVGRGYDGWSSIHAAAERYQDWQGPVCILYFGDHDPSGVDMQSSLQDRLGFFETSPEIVRCAIAPVDIEEFNLPCDPAKTTDTRHAGFVEKFGDRVVELDALPVDVLRARIQEAVLERIDLDAMKATRVTEAEGKEIIRQALGGTL